jgi:hypothetical protein
MTSSLTAESPTIQKLQNILGVDIRILATQVMRARKTRKWLWRRVRGGRRMPRVRREERRELRPAARAVKPKK